MKIQDFYFLKGISHPWDNNLSATTVLDLWRDKISISQEELFIHVMTTRRILQYSTQDENKISISQEELIIHEMKNRRLPRYSTQAETKSPSPKRSHHSFSKMKTCRLLQYSTNDETRSPFPKRIYSSTRWQTNRLLRYSKTQLKIANDKLREKATNRSVVNSKEKSTIHPNVKSTAVDTHPHKSQKNITTKCSSLRRRLQTTDNFISDGLHLRDVFRELLLWTANGHPIANKGQVRRRQKGFH